MSLSDFELFSEVLFRFRLSHFWGDFSSLGSLFLDNFSSFGLLFLGDFSSFVSLFLGNSLDKLSLAFLLLTNSSTSLDFLFKAFVSFSSFSFVFLSLSSRSFVFLSLVFLCLVS